MTDIFARLEGAGLPKRFVMEKTLPSWWEEEFASTNSGFQQTLYILSQRLGFSFQDLLHPDQVLEPRKEATLGVGDGTAITAVDSAGSADQGQAMLDVAALARRSSR